MPIATIFSWTATPRYPMLTAPPLSAERRPLLLISTAGKKIVDRLKLEVDAYQGGLPRTRASKFASMRMAKHLTATWSIPDNYGGMTSALLHRAQALWQEARISTDVLTFDWRPSYDAGRTQLRNRGLVGDGVDIVNMWEWLELLDEPDFQRFSPGPDVFDGFDPIYTSCDPNQEGMFRRRRYSFTGAAECQEDYFRQDGSLLVSDRRDLDGEGFRRIFLCDRSGQPCKVLKSPVEMHHFWIDQLTSGRSTFLTIDSKYVANFMVGYRRPHVTTIYMVHGSHLDWRADSPYAALTRGRAEAFRALHAFDGVVLLTDDQRRDTAARLGDFGNLHVIPNSRHVEPTNAENRHRDEGRAVVVASLDRRKQVDHAIRSVSAVNEGTQDKIALHIFGKGPDADSLHDLISNLGLQADIHLDGFTNDVTGEFARSSFSLLTSRAEGFGLVIVEAMNQGCVPICYDMKYGPAQIIDDGINGFLVPAGNESALADTIQRWMALDPQQKSAMREAAIVKSRNFGDEAVVPLWISTFLEARRWKESVKGGGKVAASDGSVTLPGDSLVVSCAVSFETPPARRGVPGFPMMLTLRERNGEDVIRRKAEPVTRLSDRSFRITSEWPFEVLASRKKGTVYDAFVEIGGSDRLPSARISAGDLDQWASAYSTVKGNLSFRI